MYISKFLVSNYKCFEVCEPTELSPGMNIVVGRNNVGKTALLEVLSFAFTSNPHRSLKTLPQRNSPLDPVSTAEVWFTMSANEVKSVLFRPDRQFLLPRPASKSPLFEQLNTSADNKGHLGDRLLQNLLSHPTSTFHVLQIQKGSEGTVLIPHVPSYSSHEIDWAERGKKFHALVYSTDRKGSVRSTGSTVATPDSDIAMELFNALKTKIYKFNAERFRVGISASGQETVLKSDASNLPEVVHNLLISLPQRFERLLAALKNILPEVKGVTVETRPNQYIELMVWPIDPKEERNEERNDLAVSLSHSGTGVGQVLSILYVVMNSLAPQVILIDEPQSFLHPGALRKLIETLKLYPQHQYIISTHAPAVISSADPDVVMSITRQEERSEIRAVRNLTKGELSSCLAELGASLADVFGADSVIWVEGSTEALCFPMILTRVAKVSLMGTAIVPVRSVGELTKKDAVHVVDLYRRIGSGSAILPPAIAFILDSECLGSEDKEEITKRSGHAAKFLPRRMYECYLLSPSAIASIANATPGFRQSPLADAEVAALISQKLNDAKYYCRREGVPKDTESKHRYVDAASILQDVFNELSSTRVAYSKVEHSMKLTEWLIENDPSGFQEITALLTSVLNP